jgi:hypothetical protein
MLTVEPPTGNFTYDEQRTFVGKIATYLPSATANVAMSGWNPYYRASSDRLLQRMGKGTLDPFTLACQARNRIVVYSWNA